MSINLKLLVPLACACFLLLAGCPLTPGGEGEVSFAMDMGYPVAQGYTISRVHVTLTHRDSGHVEEKDLTIDSVNWTASGTVTGLRLGMWDILVELYEGSVLIADGSGEADVQANKTAKARIILHLQSGAIEITVSWGDYWAISYSRDAGDVATLIRETSDGSLVVAGASQGHATYGFDYWVLKLDRDGGVIWQKLFQLPGSDLPWSMMQNSAGDLFIAGTQDVFNWDNTSIMVLRVNSAGGMSWCRTYGGVAVDEGYSLLETTDGGFILAGRTTSFGTGQDDFFVMNCDANGTILWQKTYGTPEFEACFSIAESEDGGYVLVGQAASGLSLMKLSAEGVVLSYDVYSGVENIDLTGTGEAIDATADNRHVIAGFITYADSSRDAFVLKLDPEGTIVWQKAFGGVGDEYGEAVCQTFDGGCLVVGQTDSWGMGEEDAWVVKLDSDGNIEWQRAFGSEEPDLAYSVQQVSTGGYVVAGHRDNDYWVLRLEENGACFPIGVPTSAHVASTSLSRAASSCTVTTGSAASTIVTPTVVNTSAIIVQQAP